MKALLKIYANIKSLNYPYLAGKAYAVYSK
jgi:hypothetical protein